MESNRTKITFQCEYTLLRREHHHSESHDPSTFSQTHPSGRTVQIILSYSSGNVIARMSDIDAPNEVVTELSVIGGRFEGSSLSELTNATIGPPLGEIRKSVKNLLALVKYHLRHYDLLEGSYSVKSEQWQAGTDEFRNIPSRFFVSHDNFSSQPLNDNARKAVQEALDEDTLPLVAMRHLHRAKNESQPHHKWIDATIAAELAVKEVLCRAHPAMESMLIEMPSPPFSKMFGPLLKQYLGEESPFRKKLISGQEKRNVLVHRPSASKIDHQEANDYVATVEGAIFHMLSLLYPHDELIRQAYYRTKA